MPDRASFVIVNDKEVQRAFQLAPKDMARGLKREFNRGRTRFVNVTRKAIFSGGGGIALPSRERSKSIRAARRGQRGKQGASANIKATQLRHLKAKVIVKKGVYVLVSYLSRFSEFHEPRLRPIFDGLFKLAGFALRARISKESIRLARLAIEGRLKFRQSRFR